MLSLIVVFVVLQFVGLVMNELSWRGVGICLLLAAGAFAACGVFSLNVTIFMVALGLIDIALIFVIFKGDIQIR